MTQRTHFALLPLISVLAISLPAQSIQDSGSSEPESPIVSSPFVEATTAYEPELARTNYLDLGFSTQAMFDDNVLSTPTNTASDYSYIVAPNIGLRQSRGRLDWKMSYAGGFTV